MNSTACPKTASEQIGIFDDDRDARKINEQEQAKETETHASPAVPTTVGAERSFTERLHDLGVRFNRERFELARHDRVKQFICVRCLRHSIPEKEVRDHIAGRCQPDLNVKKCDVCYADLMPRQMYGTERYLQYRLAHLMRHRKAALKKAFRPVLT